MMSQEVINDKENYTLLNVNVRHLSKQIYRIKGRSGWVGIHQSWHLVTKIYKKRKLTAMMR